MSKISDAWVNVTVDARIAAHVRAWEKTKGTARPRPLETLPFVTISREFGCEALPLAQLLIQILNERCRPAFPWVAYDREVIDRVALEMQLSREIVESIDAHRRDVMSELFESILNRKVDEALVFRQICQVIRSLASHGHAVLVGRGSYLITQDLKTGLHVRLIASRAWRTHCVADRQKITFKEAEKLVEKFEKERERFLNTFFIHDPKVGYYHDLVIDNARFNLKQIGEIVFAALSARFGQRLIGT